MTTSSVFLIFSGCFCLYNTSKKAMLSDSFAFETWLQSNIRSSRIIGTLLIIMGLLMTIPVFGTTSGILFWLFALSTILSLMIVLAPLKNVNYKTVILLFLISMVVELIF